MSGRRLGLPAALAIVLCMLAGACAAAQTPTPPAAVRIVLPAPGAVLTGTQVLIALAGPDGGLPPGAAYHLLLDGADVLQTAEPRISLQPVAPGPHTLRVELQDAAGGVLAAPASVAFTLVAAPATPGATWWLGGIVALLAAVLSLALLLLWLLWVRPVQMQPVSDAMAPDGGQDGAPAGAEPPAGSPL